MEAAVVENSVDVRSSPEEVFDYCTDLAREHEWNPKLRRAEKLTVDPIGVGTRFHEARAAAPRPLHASTAGAQSRLEGAGRRLSLPGPTRRPGFTSSPVQRSRSVAALQARCPRVSRERDRPGGGEPWRRR